MQELRRLAFGREFAGEAGGHLRQLAGEVAFLPGVPFEVEEPVRLAVLADELVAAVADQPPVVETADRHPAVGGAPSLEDRAQREASRPGGQGASA